MLADVWQSLEHPVTSGVIVIVVLAALAWAGNGARRHLRNLADLGTYVVPHFRPLPDAHGVLDDSHTLPARVDAVATAQTETHEEVTTLSAALTHHMESEEVLRTADLEHRAAIDAERDRKLNDVLARLGDGNPEIRSEVSTTVRTTTGVQP